MSSIGASQPLAEPTRSDAPHRIENQSGARAERRDHLAPDLRLGVREVALEARDPRGLVLRTALGDAAQVEIRGSVRARPLRELP